MRCYKCFSFLHWIYSHVTGNWRSYTELNFIYKSYFLQLTIRIAIGIKISTFHAARYRRLFWDIWLEAASHELLRCKNNCVGLFSVSMRKPIFISIIRKLIRFYNCSFKPKLYICVSSIYFIFSLKHCMKQFYRKY